LPLPLFCGLAAGLVLLLATLNCPKMEIFIIKFRRQALQRFALLLGFGFCGGSCCSGFGV